jgi:hypothetical protein
MLPMSHSIFRWALLALCFVLAGCTKPVDSSASKASSTLPQSTPAVNAEDIPGLIGQGDYVAAIRAIEQSQADESEKLGTSGRLILDALVDPAAKSRPSLTLDEGIARMERAVVLGRANSMSDLIAVFDVGVNYRGQNAVLNPVPELASCWRSAKESKRSASECVDLRKKLGVPSR